MWEKIPGSPHLHNFSVHALERGSLGTRLKESDSHYMPSHYSAGLQQRRGHTNDPFPSIMDPRTGPPISNHLWLVSLPYSTCNLLDSSNQNWRARKPGNHTADCEFGHSFPSLASFPGFVPEQGSLGMRLGLAMIFLLGGFIRLISRAFQKFQ